MYSNHVSGIGGPLEVLSALSINESLGFALIQSI
jgi:hypothetical protein